jgi:cytochrome P450 family 135
MMLTRFGGDRAAMRRFDDNRRAVDEILFEEIARRRKDPGLDGCDDVFSALLLAGHETTATGLAWTFDLLLHDPGVHQRAGEADAEYLDAVVKEALRIRPVTPASAGSSAASRSSSTAT